MILTAADSSLIEDMTFFFEIIRRVAMRSFLILTDLLSQEMNDTNHSRAVHALELLRVEGNLISDFKEVLQYDIRDDEDKIEILEMVKNCYSTLENKANLYKGILIKWRENCIVRNIDYKIYPLLKDINL